MAKSKEIKEVYIQGKKLRCQICDHALFWSRKTLMNTPGMSFLNLDWANKSATNHICNQCGYVHWFFN
jgi:rubrerythrin